MEGLIFGILQYFRVAPSLYFEARLSAKPLMRKLFNILMQIKHILFHKKGFALNLVFKVKVVFTSLLCLLKLLYFFPYLLAKIQSTGLMRSL